MIISIASGKGGTGKTTVATNLAYVISQSRNVTLLDADVEAPNCHLFFEKALEKTEDVYLPVPVINEEKCTLCGKCGEICQYNAIGVFGKSILTFPELCHNCGGCTLVCPEGAITEEDYHLGEICSFTDDNLKSHTGFLNVGESKAPPLIRAVKNYLEPDDINIIDSPPGTSCSMVEAVKDADYIVMVTEPTPFGLYDLDLAAQVVDSIGIPYGIVVNRANDDPDPVDEFCRQRNIPILLKIPEEQKYASVYSKGQLLVKHFPQLKNKFENLYKKIAEQTRK